MLTEFRSSMNQICGTYSYLQDNMLRRELNALMHNNSIISYVRPVPVTNDEIGY